MREAAEDWGRGGGVRGGVCVVGGVPSFAQEREVIFSRWLAEAEQLLGHRADRDNAYAAWTDGYSAAEYAAEDRGRAR